MFCGVLADFVGEIWCKQAYKQHKAPYPAVENVVIMKQFFPAVAKDEVPC